MLFAELRNRSKALECIARAVEVDLGGEMNCRDVVGSWEAAWWEAHELRKFREAHPRTPEILGCEEARIAVVPWRYFSHQDTFRFLCILNVLEK